jgi:hypothetical protein
MGFLGRGISTLQVQGVVYEPRATTLQGKIEALPDPTRMRP